jgi:hypothetical protein
LAILWNFVGLIGPASPLLLPLAASGAEALIVASDLYSGVLLRDFSGHLGRVPGESPIWISSSQMNGSV